MRKMTERQFYLVCYQILALVDFLRLVQFYRGDSQICYFSKQSIRYILLSAKLFLNFSFRSETDLSHPKSQAVTDWSSLTGGLSWH